LETVVQGILLDVVHGLLDSLRDIVAIIHLVDGQLVFNILARAILHVLDLRELDLHGRGLTHVHHVLEWLLHLHELIASHHSWRELSLHILVSLSSRRIGREHDLHVDVWVHVHSLPWESHLGGHHHATRELVHASHVHAHRRWHTLWLRRHVIVHFLGRTTTPIFVLSKLSFAMGVRAFVLIFTVAVYIILEIRD
jgi:hypothetical protein